MTVSLGRLLALGFVAAVAVACSAKSDAAPERLCTPGAYVFCRCANRDEGTKLCKPDAQSFDACLPCDSSGSPGVGSGGTDGIGAHSSGSSSGDGSGAKNNHPPATDGGPSTTDPVDGGSSPTDPADAGVGPQPATDASSPPDPTPTPTPTPSPSGDSGSPPPITSRAPSCLPLTNTAPAVEVQQIADDLPTAVGGTVIDGLYVQTWAVKYTGRDGDQGVILKTKSRETLEISGDVGRFAYGDDDQGEKTGGFRPTFSGTSTTIAYECPATAPKTFSYDAKGDDLAIYDAEAKLARFFTRQTGGQP